MEDKPVKYFHPVKFIGMILSIVFEFIGFLLFFAFAGYFLMNQFYKENYLVFLIFIFMGFFSGIYYIYKRAKSLSEYKLLKENSSNIFRKENSVEKKILEVRKELNEYDKLMQSRFKKIKKRSKDETF